MKRILFLLTGTLPMLVLNAQDLSDAVRYSQDEIQGSARFRALSGAFGALGGDMSAININPAGSAIFNQSHASFSASNVDVNNDVQYFNDTTTNNTSNFDIHQGGAAFVFASRNNSPWRKFTLGIAYDRTNNFDNAWSAIGTNNISVDRYFLQITEDYEIPFGVLKLQSGEFLEEAYASIGADPNLGWLYQQVFLGYWGGLIDPVNTDDATNDNNIDYQPTLSDNSYYQEYYNTSTGYNGKVAFNFATQYMDNLYLGVNLNSHFINYNRSSIIFENDIEFENNLSTRGTGFSFQLGGIMKLSPEFRAGLTYDSPIWYTIDEETTQYINSDLADPDIQFVSDVVNVYPSYRLQTPAKFTGSLAYVFNNQGLISFDYSTKDYSKTEFKPSSDFTDLNPDVNEFLGRAATYRLGGEYKYQKFSFRGGYRFEESPYVDGVTVGDLTGFSLGLGYSFGNTKLDLTYDRSERDFETPLYNVGLTDAALINRINSNVTLSLSFNI